MQCRRHQFNFWVGKIRWRKHRLPTPVFLGIPCSSAGKKSTCNVGDLGSIPGLGRSPGEGKGYPLQYSGLENSMDCIVHGGYKELDTTEPLSLHLSSIMGFPYGTAGKESVCNAGDLGSIPGSGRSPEERNGNPLQCSCLENSIDRGVW